MPATGNAEVTFRTAGCCLITGGAGAIGLELAKALVQKGARLLAIIDTPQEISRRESEINKQFQILNDRGGSILCIGADICDQSQVSSAVNKIRETFGRINGVIHAAGVAQSEIIRKLQQDKVERVFGPKVWGTEFLAAELEKDAPEFVLLCSSIDAIRGSYGQADYCAANAFQDAFSHHMRLKGHRYISINWDVWQKVGMASRVEVSPSMKKRWRQELALGIKPSEGRHIFNRALCQGKAQIVISTTDLDSRIGQFPFNVSQSEREGLGQQETSDFSGTIEDKILEIFKIVLDDPTIKPEDDFFLKGGDSLLAMRITSKINSRYGIDLPISSLFEAPTATSLSDILREDLNSKDAGKRAN